MTRASPTITHEGRIYGVPAFSFVDWIYYRKDWFDAAGIAVPTTLAELRDAAIKLTDASRRTGTASGCAAARAGRTSSST